MAKREIVDKIFKSIVVILMGSLSVIGGMAVMVSVVRPELLSGDFIMEITYFFFPFVTLLFLVSILMKKDGCIWH